MFQHFLPYFVQYIATYWYEYIMYIFQLFYWYSILLVSKGQYFLFRPSFIITIVIKKGIRDGLLYSLRCRLSVTLSVPIEGLIQTWSTYIKLKDFLPGTRKWWWKFCPENHKDKKLVLGGFFSHKWALISKFVATTYI
jgi:hypothetical protein